MITHLLRYHSNIRFVVYHYTSISSPMYSITMKVAIAILSLCIIQATARSYYDNQEDQYRRAFDALVDNLMMKRTATTDLVNFAKAHRTDPALEHVGDDLRLLGQLLDKYIATGDDGTLVQFAALMNKYVTDVDSEGTLATFLKAFAATLHPNTRRNLDDY